jgi:hypothetical protein
MGVYSASWRTKRAAECRACRVHPGSSSSPSRAAAGRARALAVVGA